MQKATRPERTLQTVPPTSPNPRLETAFGEPRNFLNNRFSYLVVSQRARGLTVGVNLNPDQACNFNCVYCEVKRARAPQDQRVNVALMSAELKRLLATVRDRKVHELACYRNVPPELLELRCLSLSGNGEPTLCPNFSEVVQAVVHIRAMSDMPFFKIVLITNGSGLNQPAVLHGLRWFTARDEIWVKLDAGSQAAMERVNRTTFPLETILANIVTLGRKRPIVVQSLFPLLHEHEPTAEEIDDYVQRLAELKKAGAAISLVQIYSAQRPTALPDCRHLSLEALSKIAQQVKQHTGLEAEVF